ncbi:putative DNA polymerase III delta' subunit [Solidesulfovibrio carbinoliphilus subsp. oakridgensis]|uniref:DNA polymerase III delta' subunit n=1 Tax=Solidesulfovibrio carbinoliphilus subsp. oakridgensis TaxID=694327 RepID=G7QA87_9BACT|nr:DNA polymerase III subunit delta' [Solidesulfovibrio carbinoliphilus]EHJ48238.1 putative DNA polymerase III delta' subunit [Solidesulfovibrio carbinoliphilus subsp. oakridgensis]
MTPPTTFSHHHLSTAAAAFAIPERQTHVLAGLHGLTRAMPQALILEGGQASERAAVAVWLAARLNCREDGSPCGRCPTCRQVLDKVFLDLQYFDGGVETIKVDTMREVRRLVGEPPRGPGRRVIILAEAQGLTDEAANALLKAMEEPRPGNVFVLLAPQRERLFPTLVSRSFVLTLAWPDTAVPAPSGGEDDPWPLLDALHQFWRTGRGWFSAAKGRPTKLCAERALTELSRGLAGYLAGRNDSDLAVLLGPCRDPDIPRRFDLLLSECQEALIVTVNPALVLDRLATRAYLWFRG